MNFLSRTFCMLLFLTTPVFAALHDTISEYKENVKNLLAQNPSVDERVSFRKKWIQQIENALVETSNKDQDYQYSLEQLIELYTSDNDYSSAYAYNLQLIGFISNHGEKTYWAINAAELAYLKTRGQSNVQTETLNAFQVANSLIFAAESYQGFENRLPSFLFDYSKLLENAGKKKEALNLINIAIALFSQQKLKPGTYEYNEADFEAEAIAVSGSLGDLQLAHILLDQYQKYSNPSLPFGMVLLTFTRKALSNSADKSQVVKLALSYLNQGAFPISIQLSFADLLTENQFYIPSTKLYTETLKRLPIDNSSSELRASIMYRIKQNLVAIGDSSDAARMDDAIRSQFPTFYRR